MLRGDEDMANLDRMSTLSAKLRWLRKTGEQEQLGGAGKRKAAHRDGKQNRKQSRLRRTCKKRYQLQQPGQQLQQPGGSDEQEASSDRLRRLLSAAEVKGQVLAQEKTEGCEDPGDGTRKQTKKVMRRPAAAGAISSHMEDQSVKRAKRKGATRRKPGKEKGT